MKYKARMISNFNPRSPCGERRRGKRIGHTDTVFQSTLPLRGATAALLACVAIQKYFNPRSPCGERQRRVRVSENMRIFQSTLPLRGATPGQRRARGCIRFQSTLPLRGATRTFRNAWNDVNISIHAPLAGSDFPHRAVNQGASDFNPRSPCGERLLFFSAGVNILLFQSTLPLRGATNRIQQVEVFEGISIHAPLAGSDYTKN